MLCIATRERASEFVEEARPAWQLRAEKLFDLIVYRRSKGGRARDPPTDCRDDERATERIITMASSSAVQERSERPPPFYLRPSSFVVGVSDDFDLTSTSTLTCYAIGLEKWLAISSKASLARSVTPTISPRRGADVASLAASALSSRSS
ncbi:hypothetical protein AXG93_1774s1360 [Marchantia polymorpha subsp. ruderalis]|uniref:Uncharacterized protein n=1 Tax=Marchantia polymorpha subsp. ruderalis TaxID=1480154 RepID=A0A176W4B3_MARPO|nr:hypothetical protein AXG93_1774s1360 [Marchantia polymorpha subsp. ruderalis]